MKKPTDTDRLNYILKQSRVCSMGGIKSKTRKGFDKRTQFVFRIYVPGYRQNLTKRGIDLVMKKELKLQQLYRDYVWG